MGLSIYLSKTENNLETTVYNSYITHNVALMWELAGIKEILYRTPKGTKCGSLADKLLEGLIVMLKCKEQFERLNPENGWGDYGGAVSFLVGLVTHCYQYPDAFFECYP